MTGPDLAAKKAKRQIRCRHQVMTPVQIFLRAFLPTRADKQDFLKYTPMPTYEYLCNKCGKEFEVFQSMKDDPLKICTCGKKGQVQRKIGAGAGLIFKGSGFYITDYKNKHSESSSSSPQKSSSSTSGTAKKDKS